MFVVEKLNKKLLQKTKIKKKSLENPRPKILQLYSIEANALFRNEIKKI